MKSWNFISAAVLSYLIANVLAGSTAHAADEVLNDLAGRIEYAFYADDRRSLLQSVHSLEQLEVKVTDAELRTSYLNYGRWKLAQLLTTEDPGQAQMLAQACAQSTSSAKAGITLAVHKAVVAACLDRLEALRPVRGLLYRRDREANLAQALQEGGKSAQVQFIAAWLTVTKSAEKKVSAQTYTTIKQAVDQYRTAEIESPAVGASWGYAEACYLLGKAELARGDLLAARNALEQALVLAPDYRAAQQLLRTLNLK